MQWMIWAVLCIVAALQLRETAGGYTQCTVNTPVDYNVKTRTRNTEDKCKTLCDNKADCIGYVYTASSNKCEMLWLGSGPNATYTIWNVTDSWVNRACPVMKFSFDGNDNNTDYSSLAFHPNESSIVKPIGKISNGADLSQTNDFLTIRDPVANQSPLTCVDATQGCSGLTLAFWINITNKASGYNYIFHGDQLRFREFQGRMDAYVKYWDTPTTRRKASIDLTGFSNHSVWIHVALVFTPGTSLDLKLYINGEDKNAVPDPPGGTTAGANDVPDPFADVAVNSARQLSHNALIQLDELLGFDKPLNATEVQDLYNTY